MWKCAQPHTVSKLIGDQRGRTLLPWLKPRWLDDFDPGLSPIAVWNCDWGVNDPCWTSTHVRSIPLFPRDFSELSVLLSHNEFDNVRFALRFCQIPMFAFNASLIWLSLHSVFLGINKLIVQTTVFFRRNCRTVQDTFAWPSTFSETCHPEARKSLKLLQEQSIIWVAAKETDPRGEIFEWTVWFDAPSVPHAILFFPKVSHARFLSGTKTLAQFSSIFYLFKQLVLAYLFFRLNVVGGTLLPHLTPPKPKKQTSRTLSLHGPSVGRVPNRWAPTILFKLCMRLVGGLST